jgi:hypothetical protein
MIEDAHDKAEDLRLPTGDAPSCRACRGEIDPDATRCPHCGQLLREAKTCPQCAETVQYAARVCRFCRYDFVNDPLHAFTPPDTMPANALIRQLQTDPLGGMISEQSITNLFLPPLIVLNRREIVIKRWAWLGLRKYEQKVSLERVASVRSMRGIFWSSLVVETLGGAMSDLVIQGLNKAESEEMAGIIEQYTIQRQGKSQLF